MPKKKTTWGSHLKKNLLSWRVWLHWLAIAAVLIIALMFFPHTAHTNPIGKPVYVLTIVIILVAVDVITEKVFGAD